MKKIAGIVLTMVIAGVLLTSCYSTCCQKPMVYRGEG